MSSFDNIINILEFLLEDENSLKNINQQISNLKAEKRHLNKTVDKDVHKQEADAKRGVSLIKGSLGKFADWSDLNRMEVAHQNVFNKLSPKGQELRKKEDALIEKRKNIQGN